MIYYDYSLLDNISHFTFQTIQTILVKECKEFIVFIVYILFLLFIFIFYFSLLFKFDCSVVSSETHLWNSRRYKNNLTTKITKLTFMKLFLYNLQTKSIKATINAFKCLDRGSYKLMGVCYLDRNLSVCSFYK